MAHTLLTQHLSLLSNKQRHSLKDFQKAVATKRERARITPVVDDNYLGRLTTTMLAG